MRLLSRRMLPDHSRRGPSRLAESGRRLRALLAGDANLLAGYLDESSPAWSGACALVVVLGCGVYGATLGWWRDPLQAFYTAVKFPLLVLLTCAGNALLNGLLGQVLGLGLSIRRTTLTIFMSFALAALVLAALSPVMMFLLWNTPPLSAGGAVLGHSLLLTAHVAVIAFAGVVANRRLLSLLQRLTGQATAARTVLFAWLAGNLLLGSQLAWVLRPFVGSPSLPVQFLRADPLRGNFFEALWHAFRHLVH